MEEEQKKINQEDKKMEKINYWNVKEFKSEEDKIACEKAWANAIELVVDEYGRVYDEAFTIHNASIKTSTGNMRIR